MKVIKNTTKDFEEIKNTIPQFAAKSVYKNWDKNIIIYKIRKKSFILTYHKANLSAPTRSLSCKAYESQNGLILKGIISSLILDSYTYLFLLLFSSIIPILFITFETHNVQNFADFKVMLITALVLEVVIFLFFSTFIFLASCISQILPLKKQEEELMNVFNKIVE